MILTEEQARNKACCKERMDPCQASECMAWRFLHAARSLDGKIIWPGTIGEAEKLVAAGAIPVGYCGLAGWMPE